MKTQRRHDLKENDLVHALETGRDYLDQNGRRLGLAVVVVSAVIAVTALTVRSQTSAKDDRWRQLGELAFDNTESGRDSIVTLGGLIKETTDLQFVRKSLTLQGQESLKLALRVEAPPDAEFNESARSAFDQLLRDCSSDHPMSFALAHLGLATVEENAFILDTDVAHKEAARKHLSLVAEDSRFDLLPFKRMAKDRLTGLDKIFTRVMFDDPLPEETEPAAPATDVP